MQTPLHVLKCNHSSFSKYRNKNLTADYKVFIVAWDSDTATFFLCNEASRHYFGQPGSESERSAAAEARVLDGRCASSCYRDFELHLPNISPCDYCKPCSQTSGRPCCEMKGYMRHHASYSRMQTDLVLVFGCFFLRISQEVGEEKQSDFVFGVTMSSY